MAAKFASFLVKNKCLSSAPIPKTRVRELYLKYQETNPSRIHVNEIINGLYLIHVVKKGLDCSVDNPTVQFKSSILPSESGNLIFSDLRLLYIFVVSALDND